MARVEEIANYHVNSVFYHCIFSLFCNITSLFFNLKETTYALCTHSFFKHPTFLTRAQDSIQERRLSFEFCARAIPRHLFTWEYNSR
mmetsp:Transcript_15833/g.19274  ORF Transcript_15833/g.19274 Transcript_15833/m.19274 type:complete len:87 (+) Transcript_15833:65-325(+)